GHPPENPALALVDLQHPVDARRRPLGAEEVRRGRTAATGRLPGHEKAGGANPAAGQGPPDRGRAAPGAALRGHRQPGRGGGGAERAEGTGGAMGGGTEAAEPPPGRRATEALPRTSRLPDAEAVRQGLRRSRSDTRLALA